MAVTMGADHLRSCHFSLGDSTDGPVGYCARVVAASEEAAVARLRAQVEGLNRELAGLGLDEGVEYLVVYFQPAALSTEAIDEVDELDQVHDPEVEPCP